MALAVLTSWIVTLVLAWLGIGTWLGFMVEDVAPEYRPLLLPVLALGMVVVSIVLTVIWARGIGRSEPGELPAAGMGRRRFLVGAGATLGGVVGTAVAAIAPIYAWRTKTLGAVGLPAPTLADSPEAAWSGARVSSYRRLGRTGVKVSDISLGSARIREDQNGEAVARAAIDRGVTYFDTSPDYSGAGSEVALGRAMKGRRDQMFLATKFCKPHGHVGVGASVEEYMQVVEESLGRLQTDYVDLVHIHSCDSVERLLDPNVHEAFDRLKAQGKVRFMGVSSHTPKLEIVANAAIDSDRFDVLMLAYHHGSWPQLADIVDRAASKDLGVVAMKTLKGAYHRGLLDSRAEADSYTQAAFKWVLQNPSVACLVVSMQEMAQLDEYLYASGKPFESTDVAVLDKYDQRIAGKHCFQHCGACLDACPESVRIDDVLRYRMYFESYGDEKEAMRLYSSLERQADVCVGCAAPCTGSCPHGIQIQQRTTEAHSLLTLA